MNIKAQNHCTNLGVHTVESWLHLCGSLLDDIDDVFWLLQKLFIEYSASSSGSFLVKINDRYLILDVILRP